MLDNCQYGKVVQDNISDNTNIIIRYCYQVLLSGIIIIYYYHILYQYYYHSKGRREEEMQIYNIVAWSSFIPFLGSFV